MKSNGNDKYMNIDDLAITLEVDGEVIQTIARIHFKNVGRCRLNSN